MVRPGAGGVDGMVFLGRRKSESGGYFCSSQALAPFSNNLTVPTNFITSVSIYYFKLKQKRSTTFHQTDLSSKTPFKENSL